MGWRTFRPAPIDAGRFSYRHTQDDARDAMPATSWPQIHGRNTMDIPFD
jgi:hypothetical protein